MRGWVCHLSRSQSAVHDLYIYSFVWQLSTQSFVNSPVPCGYILFTVLHVTLVYEHMYKVVQIWPGLIAACLHTNQSRSYLNHLVCTMYVTPLSVLAWHSRSHRIIHSSYYNNCLVTWTVVCVTAAKFKLLIYCVGLLLFQRQEYLHFCDFVWLLLVTCTIMLWNHKYTVLGKPLKLTDRHVPWEFTSWRQSQSGTKPLEAHEKIFFWQLNPYGHSPCETFSLMRECVCLLWICLAFVKHTYSTYSMTLKILPLTKYRSPLLSRFCREDDTYLI
jgi:hypothetical protein